MAILTIRNLPEGTERALQERAARHDRSVEAEVRDILQRAVGVGDDFVSEWLQSARSLTGEFEIPGRSAPRRVDLS